MKKISFLLIFIMFSVAASAEKVDLAFKLEKGQQYSMTTTSKGTIIQEMHGMEINMEVIIGGTMSFFVKYIKDADYIMDAQFDELNISMIFPQGEMSFSSEKDDPEDFFSKTLTALTQTPFEVTMDRKGQVINTQNIEELLETAVEANEEISDAQKEQIKSQIKSAYGEEGLKGSIEMATAIYPETPINKGDSWIIETNLESGFSALIKTEYKFVELTPTYALIKGTAAISTDQEVAVMSSGIPMNYDLTGTMTSDIKVDPKTGWVIDATIRQEIEGNAIIKKNEQIPEDTQIPMKIINETIIKNAN